MSDKSKTNTPYVETAYPDWASQNKFDDDVESLGRYVEHIRGGYLEAGQYTEAIENQLSFNLSNALVQRGLLTTENEPEINESLRSFSKLDLMSSVNTLLEEEDPENPFLGGEGVFEKLTAYKARAELNYGGQLAEEPEDYLEVAEMVRSANYEKHHELFKSSKILAAVVEDEDGNEIFLGGAIPEGETESSVIKSAAKYGVSPRHVFNLRAKRKPAPVSDGLMVYQVQERQRAEVELREVIRKDERYESVLYGLAKDYAEEKTWDFGNKVNDTATELWGGMTRTFRLGWNTIPFFEDEEGEEQVWEEIKLDERRQAVRDDVDGARQALLQQLVKETGYSGGVVDDVLNDLTIKYAVHGDTKANVSPLIEYTDDKEQLDHNVHVSKYSGAMVDPSLLTSPTEFRKALVQEGVTRAQRQQAESQRKLYLEDQFFNISAVIYAEDKFADDWMEARMDGEQKGLSHVAILEKFRSEVDFSSLMHRAKGVGSSAYEGFTSIIFGVAAAADADWGRAGLQMIAENNAQSREVAKVFGLEMGAGQDMMEAVAPMVADAVVTAGLVAVAAPTAGTSLAGLAAYAGAKTTATVSARLVITAAARGALKTVGKETVEAAAERVLKSGALKGATRERTVTVIKAYNGNIAKKMGVATATFIPAATRSGANTYGAVFQTLTSTLTAKHQAEDGSWEEGWDADRVKEEAHNAAFGSALTAGVITGLLTSGLSAIGRGGLEETFLRGMSFRQIKKVTSNILGRNLGDETFITVMKRALKKVMRKHAIEGPKSLLRSGVDEGFEEGLDEFLNTLITDAYTNQNTPMWDRMKQVGHGILLGAGLGAGGNFVSKAAKNIAPNRFLDRNAAARVEQEVFKEFEREVKARGLGDTLRETGSPATAMEAERLTRQYKGAERIAASSVLSSDALEEDKVIGEADVVIENQTKELSEEELDEINYDLQKDLTSEAVKAELANFEAEELLGEGSPDVAGTSAAASLASSEGNAVNGSVAITSAHPAKEPPVDFDAEFEQAVAEIESKRRLFKRMEKQQQLLENSGAPSAKRMLKEIKSALRANRILDKRKADGLLKLAAQTRDAKKKAQAVSDAKGPNEADAKGIDILVNSGFPHSLTVGHLERLGVKVTDLSKAALKTLSNVLASRIKKKFPIASDPFTKRGQALPQIYGSGKVYLDESGVGIFNNDPLAMLTFLESGIPIPVPSTAIESGTLNPAFEISTGGNPRYVTDIMVQESGGRVSAKTAFDKVGALEEDYSTIAALAERLTELKKSVTLSDQLKVVNPFNTRSRQIKITTVEERAKDLGTFANVTNNVFDTDPSLKGLQTQFKNTATLAASLEMQVALYEYQQDSASESQGFTTAKGSTYAVDSDGKTTRNKAYRPEHGAKEQGLQRKSEKTIYLTRENANALAPTVDGGRYVDHGKKKMSFVTVNADGKSGVAPSQKEISYSTSPTVGLIPLELNDFKNSGFNGWHFGNEITGISGNQLPPVPFNASAILRGQASYAKRQQVARKKRSTRSFVSVLSPADIAPEEVVAPDNYVAASANPLPPLPERQVRDYIAGMYDIGAESLRDNPQLKSSVANLLNSEYHGESNRAFDMPPEELFNELIQFYAKGNHISNPAGIALQKKMSEEVFDQQGTNVGTVLRVLSLDSPNVFPAIDEDVAFQSRIRKDLIELGAAALQGGKEPSLEQALAFHKDVAKTTEGNYKRAIVSSKQRAVVVGLNQGELLFYGIEDNSAEGVIGALEKLASQKTKRTHKHFLRTLFDAADALLQQREFIKTIKFSFEATTADYAGRTYIDQDGTPNVVINTARDSDGGVMDTLIHELVHAFTDRVLNLDPALRTPEQNNAVSSIESLMKLLRKRAAREGAPDSVLYGLTNINEFASVLMTSSDFQSFIRGIKVGAGQRNFLTRALAAISRFFAVRGGAQVKEFQAVMDVATLVGRAGKSEPSTGAGHASQVASRVTARQLKRTRLASSIGMAEEVTANEALDKAAFEYFQFAVDFVPSEINIVMDNTTDVIAEWDSETESIVFNGRRAAAKVNQLVAAVDGKPIRREHIIAAILNEEIAHVAAFARLSKAEVQALMDGLSDLDAQSIVEQYYPEGERAAALERFRSGDSSISEGERFVLAEEQLRIHVQKVLRGAETNEQVNFLLENPTTLGTVKQYFKNFLTKLTYTKTLKGVSPQMRDSVNRVVSEVRAMEMGYRLSPNGMHFDANNPEGTLNQLLKQMEMNKSISPREDDEGRSRTLQSRLGSDTDYLAAVESGDMDAAQEMVDEATGELTGKFHGGTAGGKGHVVLFADRVEDSYWNGGPMREGKGLWTLKNTRPVTDEMINFAADYFKVSKEEATSMMNPSDVVNSAEAWDNPQFVSDLWQEFESDFIEDGDSFETPDGAVSFPQSDALIPVNTDPVTYDESGAVIPLSQRFGEKKSSRTLQSQLGSDADLTEIPIALNKKGKPITQPYALLKSPTILEPSGNGRTDIDPLDFDSLHYEVTAPARKRISAAIKSGSVGEATDRLVGEVNEMLKDPSVKAGIGWYSRMRVVLKNALGDRFKLFSHLLGATSAQTPVETNFIYSMEMLTKLDNGDYEPNIKGYLELRSIAPENLRAEIESRGFASASKLKKANTPAKLARLWIDHYKILPTRDNGKLYGANSLAALKAITDTWLLGKLTPKTPQFAMNLNGESLEATIDVWAARTLRRILWGDRVENWRIQPKAETGVSNEDFALGQIIFREAAKTLDMSPDDLQALVWFGEKDVWDKNGWTKEVGAFKSSFDEAAAVFFPPNETPRSLEHGKNVIKFLQKERLAVSKLGVFEENSPKLKKALKEYEEAKGLNGVGSYVESRGREPVAELRATSPQGGVPNERDGQTNRSGSAGDVRGAGRTVTPRLQSRYGAGSVIPSDLDAESIDFSNWIEMLDIPLMEFGTYKSPSSLFGKLFAGYADRNLMRFKEERDSYVREAKKLGEDFKEKHDRIIKEASKDGVEIPPELISRASGSNVGSQLTESQIDSVEARHAKERAKANRAPDAEQRKVLLALAEKNKIANARNLRIENRNVLLADRDQAIKDLLSISPEAHDLILGLRKLVDDLSAKGNELFSDFIQGKDEFSATFDMNGGLYITRRYRMFEDNDYLARVRDQSDPTYATERQDAINYFAQQYMDYHVRKEMDDKGLSKQDARFNVELDLEQKGSNARTKGKDMMTEFLNSYEKNGIKPELDVYESADGGRSIMMNSKKFKGSALKALAENLNEKKNIPAPIRRLFGEYGDESGGDNLAHTLVHTASIMANQAFFNRVVDFGTRAKEPWLVTEKEIAADLELPVDSQKYAGWQQLKSDGGTMDWNPVKGYYTKPEIIKDFQDLISISQAEAVSKEASNPATYLGSKLVTFMHRATGLSLAAKTLGSVGFYVRNMLGNAMFFGPMQGYMGGFGKAFGEGVGVVQAFGGDAENSNSQIVRAALGSRAAMDAELTVLSSMNVFGDEMEANLLRELLLGKLTIPAAESKLAKIAKAVEDKTKVGKAAYTKGVLAATRLASAMDAYYKIGLYEFELATLKEAALADTQGGEFNRLLDENNEPSVDMKRAAAVKVKKVSQSYSQAPPAIKALTRSSAGLLVAPYVRFAAEVPRVMGNTFSLLSEERAQGKNNPVMRKRYLKRLSGMLSTMGFTFAVPMLLKSLMNIGEDEDEALRSGMPYYLRDHTFYYYKADGELYSFDLTYLNPFSIVADPVARAFETLFDDDEINPVDASIELVAGLVRPYFNEQILSGAVSDVMGNTNQYGNKIRYGDDVGENVKRGFLYVWENAYEPRSLAKLRKAFKAAEGDTPSSDMFTDPLSIIFGELLPIKPHKVDLRSNLRAYLTAHTGDYREVGGKMNKLLSPNSMNDPDIFALYDDTLKTRRTYNNELRRVLKGFNNLGISWSDIHAQAKSKGVSKERLRLNYNGWMNRPSVSLFVAGKLRETSTGRVRLRKLENYSRKDNRYIKLD